MSDEQQSGGAPAGLAPSSHQQAQHHQQQQQHPEANGNGAAPAAAVHPAAEKRAQEQATAVAGENGVLIIPSKLFVGALPPLLEDQQLRDFFTPFGEVKEARIQKDKFTGESRKFGFVIMANEAGAAAAIEAHKREPLMLDGRKINVTYAEAQDQVRPGAAKASRFGPGDRGRDGYGAGGGGYGGTDQYRDRDAERQSREQALGGYGGRDATKLFVGRVDSSISDAELQEYFKQFGPVQECVIMRERGGASKGFAFLHMETTAGMDAVLRQKQHEVKGIQLHVDKSNPKPRAPAMGGYDRRDDMRGGYDRRDDRYGGGGGGGGYGGRDDRYGGRDGGYSRDPYPPRDIYPPRDPYDSRGAYPPAPYADPYAARVDPYARAPVDPRYDPRAAPIADPRYAPAPVDPYAAQRSAYPVASGYDQPRRDDRAVAPVARREEYYPAQSAYAPAPSAYAPPVSSGYAPPMASGYAPAPARSAYAAPDPYAGYAAPAAPYAAPTGYAPQPYR
jgi:RNA recognition motif-containing protein